MLDNKKLNKIIAEENYEQEEIKFLRAYYFSKERGKDYIDFDGVIWEEEIEPIYKALKKYNIKKITLSNQSTSLIETAWGMKQLGAEIVDLIEIKTGFREAKYEDGEWNRYDETTPAILIEIK